MSLQQLSADGVLTRLLKNERREGWRHVMGSLENDPDVATFISGRLMRYAEGERAGLVVMLDWLFNDPTRTLKKIMDHGMAQTVDGHDVKLTWDLAPDSLGYPMQFHALPGMPLKVIGTITGPASMTVTCHAAPSVNEFGCKCLPIYAIA